MKYTTRNGLQIEGQTASEVIDAMRESGRFTENQTTTEYLAGLAEREKEYSGIELVITSAEAFIDSALACGLLTKN